MDWAMDVGKVPLAFAFEFRDARNGIEVFNDRPYGNIYKTFIFAGGYGFMLPADQIIPNCEEFMDGLKAMVAEAVTLGYF